MSLGLATVGFRIAAAVEEILVIVVDGDCDEDNRDLAVEGPELRSVRTEAPAGMVGIVTGREEDTAVVGDMGGKAELTPDWSRGIGRVEVQVAEVVVVSVIVTVYTTVLFVMNVPVAGSVKCTKV